MHVVRVPGWGLALHDARFYGYWACLHLGPWLVFLWRADHA